MENKLEEFLNMLIKKGRKPFNVDCDWTNVEVINRLNDNRYIPEHSEIIFQTDTHRHVFDCNIRDLVSKSSWLWQFVCENGMINIPWYKNIIRQWVDTKRHKYYGKDYRYWLCESSLKDESELEDFLLSNIKVND